MFQIRMAVMMSVEQITWKRSPEKKSLLNCEENLHPNGMMGALLDCRRSTSELIGDTKISFLLALF